MSFSFDETFGIVEDTVAVTQAVFPFPEVASTVAEDKETLAMVAAMEKIAHVTLAIGEEVGSLAMGLAVAKLPHVTISAGEFPEGGDKGFVGVGWKG